MNRRTRGVLIVTSGLLALWIVVQCLRLDEPHFQGRPVSAWLDDFEPWKPKETQERAAKAVAELGERALPMLLHHLKANRDSRPRMLFYQMISKSDFLRRRLVLSGFRFDVQLRQQARDGFRILGPKAKSAIPELISLLNDKNRYIRFFTADALGLIGADAKIAVPFLIKGLNSEDPYARAHAAHSLGRIAEAPEQVVPALVNNLQHTNSEVRYRVICALGAFGWRAQSEYFKISAAQSDPDRDVREAAVSALKQIEASERQAGK